jgi:hypothetical protein
MFEVTGTRSALVFCAGETDKIGYKDKCIFFYNEDTQLLLQS